MARSDHGFTLIELMVTVAIVAILASIAIPAYNGYISLARHGVATANLDSLRLFLEDFRLEEGGYGAVGGPYNSANITSTYGWVPDGDGNDFNYSLTVVTLSTTADSYNVLATWADAPTSSWVFCENRMRVCCNNDDFASGTDPATVTACP